MSKRLQVLLDPKEYGFFQKKAKQSGMSLGEWVRQALRRISQDSSEKSANQKLASIRAALRYDGPTGDIDQILQEIEKGYLSS